MNIKKYIPNTLTLGNLFCGCLALLKTFEGDLVWAAYLVGIALVLDFFDGFTARLLKVSSPIGKDLDSLADMVTFGVVPGMVMFQIIYISIFHVPFMPNLEPNNNNDIGGFPVFEAHMYYLPYFALTIPIFSCIRLAKFNNDSRQSDSFIGLPTPANAMVICSLPLIFQMDSGFFAREAAEEVFSMVYMVLNPYILCGASIGMSILLILELPLFALKFKGFSWADPQNRLRLVFLGLALILLVSMHFLAIPLVIGLYILLSIVNNKFLKTKV